MADALAAHLDHQRARLAAVGDELAPLVDTLADFLLSGGKCLRPAFAYWAYRGAGGPDRDELIPAVAALELVQACALIHDDVMDGSDTRRGKPAIHRRFEAMHRARGWRGDPAAFGTSAAILLGDTSLIWADEMLHGSGMPADVLDRARDVYHEMRTEIMAGQYLDVLAQALGGHSVERAMRVVRYKAAKYTVERPLLFGAALAGGSAEVAATYSAYGLPLGEAFQLRDDVLGVFGDPAETGKPAGDDLREGKRTVLVALSAERATPAQADLIERHLGDPDLGGAGVDALRAVILDTGALAETEKTIAELTDRALGALQDDRLVPEAADMLRALAVAATSRRG
ncbi:MAG TPA: polyprenyl synthetase family protein [Cryptosporangiaceae bacterium]|nr:polyprenyl synthetase family protein [Cryptosporangiaceae bacterium]